MYEGVVDYLKNFNVDDRDMNKFIIGTISNIDRPMNPAAKGSRSMNLVYEPRDRGNDPPGKRADSFG